MAFLRNHPTASEFQSDSQQIIETNFNSSDDTFGIDHYAFSVTSGNEGYHKKVTTVFEAGGSHPTTTTNPVLYAMEDLAALGVIQYSRGPSDAVPSPITFLQSSTSPISLSSLATTNVFDFNGINRAFCRLYMGNFSTTNTSNTYLNSADVLYCGNLAKFRINNFSTTNNLVATSSSKILQIVNSTGSARANIYWTLQFLRIEMI